ncbi:MAG: aldo/keto reductase [Phycisphaerales bacterium]|nr:aldo/keto reductase [Phycisphaerales bacterium]
MQTQTIGKSDLICSRLAYGAWRNPGVKTPADLTAEKKEAGKRAFLAAFEAGYTLFDHANIYGRTMGESLFGELLREHPRMRRDIIIATKCGIRLAGDPTPDAQHRYDFSREHILWSCDQSLKRLGIDTIDLYQLHRPDLLMDPCEVAEAFDMLHRQGKVRYFGVSNFLPSTVTMLQSALSAPMVVQQVEIHLGRLDCFFDGTLDQCLQLNMTPLAWSPLGGGILGDGGRVPEAHANRAVLESLQTFMDSMAKRIGTSRTVLALAWLLKHPAGIIPIVGSINPVHIREAAQADTLEISREQWYDLLIAARGKRLP